MQPADVVGDRFELIRVAGAGGMGEVWLARDRALETLVALKVLSATSESARASFEREALLLAELRHPAIVRYVGHGITPEQKLYLVMEWLEGEDLSQRLLRGPLSVDETMALLTRVADALAVAHARSVIHRDIKPSNLYLSNAAIERVKILDFGIAKPADAMHRAQGGAGAMVGTPGYMAPEQARGEADVDAAADIFALGCVAFECLTGRKTFDGEHAMAVFAKILLEDVPRISDVLPEVPEALDALVHRMLSKERAGRPRDALELSAALAECAGQTAERKTPLPPSLTRSEQRFLGVVTVPAFVSDADLGAWRDSQTLRAVAEKHGARLESLADGSLLAVVAGGGGASDLTAQAAQCALAMRGVLPGRPMALTMGRGAVDAKLATEAIDRATRLLLDDAGRPRPASAGVVLDEATAAVLDARFEVVRSEDGVELKRERVLEEAPRTLLGKVTECVGREREIGTLESTFVQCATESVARAVLVTAPAGAGKSRLRNELVGRLRKRAEDAEPAGAGATEIWITRADPMRAGSAFGLAAQMLRKACGISEGEPLEAQHEKLRARVARSVSVERRRVTEFLGELAGAPFDDRDSPQLRAARQDAMLLGDQIRRAWEDFVRAESEQHPVVMILEDLHWADPPTVSLLDAVLRNLRQLPIMVLAFARADIHDRFPDLWAEHEAQEIRLAALTKKASTRIVRNALGDDVSDEIVRKIVERAEGNAFYLEELIRTVADGRGAELPETIVATVQARLERLDAAARRILRAASVFGQTFWRGAAGELLGGAAADIDEWLTHLSDAEIISRQSAAKFATEDEYTFRHALLREGAYAMLTPSDRELGHRLAGDWLDRSGERDAMVLAEHFELGGSRERALGCYPRAAEQALEGDDLEGVLARIERGIACGASGQTLGLLRGTQAEAHNWRGENAEGERRASEAMALLPVGSAAWFVAAREGIITASKLGHNDRVKDIVVTAQELRADAEAINARRMALGWGVLSLLFGGRHAAADAILDDLALPHNAPLVRDPRVEALVTRSQAVRAFLQRRPGAIELLEVSLAGFMEAGDLRNASTIRIDLGVQNLEHGAYQEAEPYLRLALEEAEQKNLYTQISQVQYNLGCALSGLGKLEDARSILITAVSALGSQGDRYMQGAAQAELARVLLKLREFEDAEHQARQAVESMQPDKAFALAVLASVLLQRDRPDEALRAAEEALAQLRAAGSIEQGESLVRLVYAEALQVLGDPRAAEAITEANLALLTHADAIADPALRRGFLESVEDNARTLALGQPLALQ